MTTDVIGALTGCSSALLGALFAMQTEQPIITMPGGDLNTWLLGMVAVAINGILGILLIIGRKFLNGDLVVRPIADLLETHAAIVKVLERIDARESSAMQEGLRRQ